MSNRLIESFVISITITLLSLGAASAWAELTPIEVAQIVDVDSWDWGGEVGYSVALDGDTAVIGVPWDNEQFPDAGAAYVFIRTGTGIWALQAKLSNTGIESGSSYYQRFGFTVAISGETVVIGAPNYFLEGRVYVFTRSGTTWSLQAELPSNGDQHHDWGRRIAISGDTIVIGEPNGDIDDVTSFNDRIGAVFVYTRSGTTWSEQKIKEGIVRNSFGTSVAVDGDTMVVGDIGDNSAYIYARSGPTWIQQARLAGLTPSNVEIFGNEVAVDGNTVLVSTIQASNSSHSGSVHVFIRTGAGPVPTWALQTELASSDVVATDRYGISLAVDGNTALVGSPYDAAHGNHTGSAYVFTRSGSSWSQEAKFTPGDVVPQDKFGWSVALDGDTALIGAPSGAYYDDGRAYIFDGVSAVSTNQPPVANAGDDQTVHQGTSVTLDGNGSSDPDENYPLTYVWMLEIPAGSSAILDDPSSVSPSFTADQQGDYTVYLSVTDSLGEESLTDEVIISTTNTAPIAEAGVNQAVISLGTTVNLDGSQSWDPDGDDITYEWMLQRPVGSVAALDDPTLEMPSFIADFQGDYIATVVVTDSNDTNSDPDSTTISFDNVMPVANAGNNQAVAVGDTVFLDGSASADVNLDPLTYQWSFVSRPAASSTSLLNPDQVQASFIADVSGSYVVSLIVNDGFVDSIAENASIEATSAQDQATQTATESIEVVNDLPLDEFRNDNNAHALTNKINQVIALIEAGDYQEALNKLQNDILKKTNGCAETGSPDRNDWIRDCDAQGEVYSLVMDTIALLQDLLTS